VAIAPPARRAREYGCGGAIAICTALLVSFVLVFIQWEGAGRQPSQAAIPVPITGSVVLQDHGLRIMYSDPNGLCRTPGLTAAETPTRVMLSLSESDGVRQCYGFRPSLGLPSPVSPANLAGAILAAGSAAVLPSYPAHVGLNSPLGDRRLVDVVTGRTIPYFDQRRALQLTASADWFSVPGGELATEAPYFGGPGAAVLVESLFGVDFRTHQPNGMSLMIVQVAGGGWHPPAGTATRHVLVRGHHGLAAAGIIVWSEAGHTVAVIGQGPVLSHPPLSFPRLEAIASALTGGTQV
jgi:hypothetical protein